jgi:hypothetical protein
MNNLFSQTPLAFSVLVSLTVQRPRNKTHSPIESGQFSLNIFIRVDFSAILLWTSEKNTHYCNETECGDQRSARAGWPADWTARPLEFGGQK